MRRMRSWMMVLATALGMSLASAADGAPPDGNSDVITDKARELHLEGEALFKKKDYARARAALLAAWALKKHWSIAGSLGDCELKLEMYRDAAEHLAYFIREVSKEKEVPPGATELLEKARSKVGTIEVTSYISGAEVLLDGMGVGMTPLPDPLFVEPGIHTVEVRPPGSAMGPSARISIEAGQRQTFAANAPADDTVSKPRAAEAAKATRVEPAEMPVEVVESPHPRREILVIGFGSAGVTGGVGAVLLAFAGVRGTSADNLLGEMRTSGERCSSPPQAGRCSDLLAQREAHDTMANVGTGLLVGAGVLAAGTLGYVVWSKTAGAPTTSAVWTAPMAGPGGGGVWVGGAF